jgi:1,4-dihydroxy-2-naphthoate octaprenyltransferase
MAMSHWIQAARPLAHVNIVVPLLLGHAAAWHVTQRFDIRWLIAAVTWGVLDHLFVIFANDFADREADSGLRTLLSGGSGVIPEGKLSPRHIERAAQLSAISLFLYSCALSLLGRPWMPLYALAALLLMWLYSFRPVRLSYRGGGEWLQGIGVGIGLPSVGYYMQLELPFAPSWVIWPATLLGVCGNVLTALPDVDDDTRAHKRTWPVRHGMASARRFASAGIAFAAFAVFVWTPGISVPAKAVVSIVPLMPLLVGARASNAFRAAWWSSVALHSLVGLWIAAMVFNL